MNPVILLSLAIIGFGVLGCAMLYRFIKHVAERRSGKAQVELQIERKNLQNQLLEFLLTQGKKNYRKTKKMNVSKISIIEKFNLKPDELMKIAEEMAENDLVTFGKETVTITPFGNQYYMSFIKGK